MELVVKEHQAKEQNSRELYFKVIDNLVKSKSRLWEDALKKYMAELGSEKRAGWMRMNDEYLSNARL